LRVAGPFGCRCPSIPPCSVSTPRSSNRACGFAAPGSPTGFFSRPTALPKDSTFTDLNSSFRDRRTLIGVARPHGQSPGSRSLPQRARSEVPSLRRHYPASTVVWTSPTPQRAQPVPHGGPVGSRTHPLGSPVLRPLSLCRHAVTITPVGSQPGWSRSPVSCDGGLPHPFAGSAPTLPVSRPARCSLTLRPACSRNRLKRSFTSEASVISLPPLPLRLLPAGTTVAGQELHLLKNGAFPRRTKGIGYIIPVSPFKWSRLVLQDF
jgi:hypothetical protein